VSYQSKTTGFARIGAAARYSWQGIVATYKNEPAFRYETAAYALLLPLSFILAQSGLQWALLNAFCLVVLALEIVNSAIEAVVDRAGTEFHPLAGLAKDCGSAAVLVAMIATGLVWAGIALDNWILG